MKKRLLMIAAVLVMMTTFSCSDDYTEVEEQIIEAPSTGPDDANEDQEEQPGPCECS